MMAKKLGFHRHKSRDAELLDRRRQVAALMLQGKRRIEIACMFGVNVSTITRDWQFCEAEQLEAIKGDIAALKAKQLAEIALMKSELWAEWHRSKQDKEAETVRETEVDDAAAESSPDSKPKKRKVQRRREGQCGNASYQKTILDCLEREAKLLGLDEPQQMRLGPVSAEDFTDDELAQRIVASDAGGSGVGIASPAACPTELDAVHAVHKSGIPSELAPPGSGGEAGPGGNGQDEAVDGVHAAPARQIGTGEPPLPGVFTRPES